MINDACIFPYVCFVFALVHTDLKKMESKHTFNFMWPNGNKGFQKSYYLIVSSLFGCKKKFELTKAQELMVGQVSHSHPRLG